MWMTFMYLKCCRGNRSIIHGMFAPCLFAHHHSFLQRSELDLNRDQKHRRARQILQQWSDANLCSPSGKKHDGYACSDRASASRCPPPSKPWLQPGLESGQFAHLQRPRQTAKPCSQQLSLWRAFGRCSRRLRHTQVKHPTCLTSRSSPVLVPDLGITQICQIRNTVALDAAKPMRQGPGWAGGRTGPS